ncbi:hypothetical protein [Helicobacter sp. 11S02596-1]|uniref:hypothetical protein n=1 Tax=Helicobacter sp. 11S02596-1 TaxID=1476194 RepID=UPI000BA686BC|nr:hypothetical protein [Helicobacter sp. 11S02596-1]PAF44833.1 hypothetical protein BJI48_02275 [Helicobacter sp. 11S02596-1]
MKKNRNFWPLGILSVIVIGIVLLVLLVRLSVVHPIIDDGAYFEKYSDVDKDINRIIKDTKAFENDYALYIGANQKPPQEAIYRPLSPYFVKGHRDKLKEQPKVELFTDAPNRIDVAMIPKVSDPLITDVSIRLFMVRYHSKTERLDLGNLECSSGTCLSPEFSIDMAGRWKAILQVTYTQNQTHKKIFFEKEFFASERP